MQSSSGSSSQDCSQINTDRTEYIHAKEEKVKSIYVGNLPYNSTEEELQELFAQHGEVQTVKLVFDRATGRPRGFGFVEMEDEEANAAIEALDGVDFGGRTLRVNEARERSERKEKRW